MNLTSPGQFLPVFSQEEFSARRQKMFDLIGPDACALIQGAPPDPGFRTFRQTNDFYYCCGIELPGAYLMLDASERLTRLYLPSRATDEDHAGVLIAASGVDEICDVHMLAAHLADAETVYVPFSPSEGQGQTRGELRRAAREMAEDPWDAHIAREQVFLARLRTRLPRLNFQDLTPLLDSLRGVKSSAEIEFLRVAGRLSAAAVAEAMRVIQPGIYEFQLAAVARYIYYLYGARGDGYRPIIPSGAQIWHSHYFQNNRLLQDGDWVLMDFAPDYGYYTSDIGRMFPVNGSYSPVQRELYGFIVEYHKAVLSHLKPGLTADQVMDAAADDMRPVVDQTSFSKDIYKQAAARTLDFRGHLSHPVGMAVHDVGNYRARALKPGVVITIDPQMWIPEEKKYVRVEDTIVITGDGYDNLTAAAPLELDAVETLMKETSSLPLPVPGLV